MPRCMANTGAGSSIAPRGRRSRQEQNGSKCLCVPRAAVQASLRRLARLGQWHGRGGFSGRTKEFFAKVRIRLLRFDLKPLPGRLVTASYELT